MSQLPGNITELIAALEGLGKRNLNEEYELFETCRGVFEKLRRLSDFDPGDIKKIVKILKGLPPEIKELKIEELEDGDKKLETRALNKQDLKELLEDYEKATNENERKRIEKEIYARTGQKNVEQFIKIQKEIANKNAEKLSKLDEEIKEGVVENLTKIKLEEKEELIDIVEEASLEEKFDEKKLKREIKKRIKNPERVEEFIQKVEEIRAEIKIKERAEEIAKTTYEKLAEEKLPINGDIKEKIKNEILIAWKEGDRIKIPTELEEISEAKVIIKETEEAVDIFKNKNIEAIVNYRSLELGKKTSQELRKNGVQDESLIREYVSVVKELTNNPDNARIEENRSDIYNFVQSENPNKGPGEMERSIDEARFIANNVVTSPKKFNKLIQKYNLLREKIGSDKLPKLKEVRVLEKMTTLFVNNPKMLKLLNGTQKVANIYNKVATFPSRMLGKLTVGVVEKIEGKLAKIGAQAATEFVKNSAAIIAKEGTAKGLGIILKSILGKGTVIAGEGAASGGAVAGLVTAFQALPVVGQIIAVVVVAAAAVLAVVKPIIDGAKKILEKVLGTNLNKIKKFVAEDLGLGKFEFQNYLD